MNNTDNIGVSAAHSSRLSFTSVSTGSTLVTTRPTTKPTTKPAEETIFATTRPDLTTGATEPPHTNAAGIRTSEIVSSPITSKIIPPAPTTFAVPVVTTRKTKPPRVSRPTPVTEGIHMKSSTESNNSNVVPEDYYDGLYPFYQKTYSPAVIASIIGSALCTILSAIAITIIVLELYRLHDQAKNSLETCKSYTRV
ncbi:hypothetical protein GCK32_007059 [Trichostrongylus colubriformis]|uniref:Uncharacterized protein n=1 Tax=Trichostrongylus colubriformis TaxID=6319 RepID=A0AAN8J2E3_TRICO